MHCCSAANALAHAHGDISVFSAVTAAYGCLHLPMGMIRAACGQQSLPARAGGIVHNISDTVVATIIADGAHHLDLMDSNSEDPPSVVAARRSHVHHMQRWLDEYYAAPPA